jgi:bisphosphoglycerate-dependent phosphoglycerate mutase
LVKKIYRLTSQQNCNINQQINSECEKIRFQNAAILKLTIYNEYNERERDKEQTTYAELTLFSQGELEDAETNTNPYFVSDINSKIRRPRHFFKVAINSHEDQIQLADFFGQDIFGLLDTLDQLNYDGLTFYIVRHGRAWHNVTVGEQVSKGFGIERHGGRGRVSQKGGWRTLDTDLTPKGVEQAKSAGIFLEQYLPDNRKEIQYVFVSDLARTFQTAFYICQQLQKIIINKKFIVLPCSNETQNNGKLNRDDKIDCDTPSTLTGKAKNLFNQENFPGCKVVNGISDCAPYKTDLVIDINKRTQSLNIELDWSHYLKKYNGQMRTGSNTGDCNNTNMFQEAIKILRTIIAIGNNTYDSNSAGAGGPSQGGRRRSRKNKKMSNKRISKKRLNKRISKKRK